MSCVLAIDVGTSTIKAVVWDADARRPLAVHSAPNGADVAGLPPDRHEQDPLRILAQCRSTLRAAAADPAVDPAAIVALAISGQMHGVLLVDRKLQPVTNLVTWRDRRAPGVALPPGAASRTGCGLHPGYGGVTLGWLAREGRLPPRATALSIASFLAATLTGKAALEETHAASWGLLDLRSRAWDEAVLGALGVPPRALPPLAPSAQPLERMLPAEARALGLPGRICVCSPIGDAQAAVIAAAGLTDRDLAVLNLGTGGQISVLQREFAVVEGLETRPMPLEGYALVGASLCGGWSYAYLARFFQAAARAFAGVELDEAEAYRRLNALAAEAEPPAGGLSVDTRFSGARGAPDLRGSIGGIDTANFTPANLARGFVEGIVGELAGMAARIAPGGIRRVLLTGNLARRNPVVLEVARARFGVPCALGEADEEAACGAAFTAGEILRPPNAGARPPKRRKARESGSC